MEGRFPRGAVEPTIFNNRRIVGRGFSFAVHDEVK
jgi:hypothetical protein